MSADETILTVRGLEKTFKSGLFGRKGFQALKGIDLEVGRGQVFGLLGPNGAGKTTMVKILLDLVRGWRGEARVFGLPPSQAVTRRRVGYLPEAHRMPYYLTGWQVMVLFGMLAGRDRKSVEKRAAQLLDRVGMLKDCHRKVREYSKGMQQRLGLAQALVHDPELVFLDEPTDGVDPVGRKVIRQMVTELAERGTTIFINSHLLNEVEMVCDRVVILNKGLILREGTIEELTPSVDATRFELLAPGASLEEELRGVGEGFRRDGERAFELTVDDAGLDATIDRLRARGHTITGISRRRLSLEDAFIDLVKEDRK
ncbi:MAG: ABC transporter ATP-binding protein [Planctomycetes bacterium]|nr:ABC transporter ATP-binding protein [Planctomycetota bacterium]